MHLLPPLFNLAYPLLCPPNYFPQQLNQFLPVTIPLSLFSLTLPGISVTFYLGLTKATGMKTCLCDTWLCIFSHCFLVWLQLSMVSSCRSIRALSQKGKNRRRMHHLTVAWYSRLFVFMKSKQDMKRRSLCTGCRKLVGVIFLGLSVLLSLRGEQGSPPSSLHCPSCHGWQALPPLPESAPTQPSIPPAASRQNSLVIPSLAPDKTPARLRHNLRPPDRPACNTNIFHKGGRRWRQMFHILDEALDVLPPCPPSLCSRWPDIWAHSLVCECVFFFLILEPPPHPCGRCIAQASLWLSPCLCTGCTYCMYTEVVLREWWLATWRLSGVWELATASALQIWSPMAVKSFTMWKPFN